MSKLSIIRRALPPSVTRKAGVMMLHARAQAPNILFGTGIVGFGVTVGLSSKATLRVEPILTEAKENLDKIESVISNKQLAEKHGYSEEDAFRDRVVVRSKTFFALVKLYAPSVICGALTIAAFSKAHSIQNARIGALAAAYAGLDKAYRSYRERVRVLVGEEKELDLYYDAQVAKIELESSDSSDTSKTVVEQKIVGDGAYSMYARFFDQTCEPWKKNPEYNWIFLRAQQQYANDMLKSRGYLFLNDVYSSLGIEPTEAGQVVGWVLGPNGDNYVDFGFLDGTKAKVREFVNGQERSILLDFNVDGYILDKIKWPGWRK